MATSRQKSFFKYTFKNETILDVQKWSIKVCSAGIFIHLGKSLILAANYSIIGHCFTHVVPKPLALLDNHELITASGFTGHSNGIYMYIIIKIVLYKS